MSILALYPKGSCLTSDTSCPCKGNTMFLVEDYEHNSVYRKCSCCCCLTSYTNCVCCMQITVSWMVTWNGYIQVRWLIRSPRCCTRSRRITCSGIRPQSQVCWLSCSFTKSPCWVFQFEWYVCLVYTPLIFVKQFQRKKWLYRCWDYVWLHREVGIDRETNLYIFWQTRISSRHNRDPSEYCAALP